MKICDKQFQEERALYHLQNTTVERCVFKGEADGESPLKETDDVTVCDSQFFLRYPLWHCRSFVLKNSVLHEPSRAPLWYCKDGEIFDCEINSIKPLRECDNITVKNCKLTSDETGWKCRNLTFLQSEIHSVYFLFDSQNVTADNVTMTGKYSFQYMKNVKITNSDLDTKDAFWHSENVVVENCRVKGEYLGWYSKNLTLINCEIIGTQPLCYCEGLKLVNCTMNGCDLAFENSDVEADIQGSVLSVKNPKSGEIVADDFGEIILQDALTDCLCKIIRRK